MLFVMSCVYVGVNSHLIHADFFQLSLRSIHSNWILILFLLCAKLSLWIFMQFPAENPPNLS